MNFCCGFFQFVFIEMTTVYNLIPRKVKSDIYIIKMTTILIREIKNNGKVTSKGLIFVMIQIAQYEF